MLLSVAARASTVISITGSEISGGNIGLVSGEQYVATSWSQTSTYDNVSMSVLFNQLGNAMMGTAYLTTQIGSGTTVSQQVASNNFTVPNNPSVWQTVLTVPTLGPGTYYLVIEPTGVPFGPGSTGTGNWWEAASSTTVSDPGVTYNGFYFTLAGGIAGYAPGSNFTPEFTTPPLQFSVTSGVPTGVPEPASAGLLLWSGAFGFLGIGLRRAFSMKPDHKA